MAKILVVIIFIINAISCQQMKSSYLYRTKNISDGRLLDKLEMKLSFAADSIQYGSNMSVILTFVNISQDSINIIPKIPTYLEKFPRPEYLHFDFIELNRITDLTTTQNVAPGQNFSMKYETNEYKHYFLPNKTYQIKAVYTNRIYKIKNIDYVAGRLISNVASITFY